MSKPLKSFLEKLKLYLHVTRADSIARRYFVMNGFDGAMTMFGIILGSWIAGVTEPKIIVVAGLGACLAIGVSGFFGAYMAEKAERERHLREMEKATDNNVEPIHYEASRFIPIYVAFIDGVSPALTATISLTPFIATLAGVTSIANAYMLSIILTLITLFSLGFYLGRIAKENGWVYGAGMLAVGIVTATVIFLIQILLH